MNQTLVGRKWEAVEYINQKYHKIRLTTLIKDVTKKG